MPVRIRYFGYAISGDRIYVTGGDKSPSYQSLNSLWIYDIGDNVWSAGPAIPIAVKGHCSTTYAGKVYIFGGQDVSSNILNSVYIYDTGTGSWSPGPATMPIGTVYSTATVLGDKIYVFGGSDDSGVLKTVQIYDPAAGDWQFGTDIPTPRNQAPSAAYNGKLYLYLWDTGSIYEGTLAPSGGRAGLSGTVVKADSSGRVLSPLAGATVVLVGEATATTDAQGQFSFMGLDPGTISVTVSKAGYYPATRYVTLGAGETRHEQFSLTEQQAGPTEPESFDFASPNGNHFIEGMPGDISFSTMVAWNGSPGSVHFIIAGDRYEAMVTDRGGGTAKATLTLPAPTLIDTCSELTIEVANGEGTQTTLKTGICFYPVPGIIPAWYGNTINWSPSGGVISHSEELNINLWEIEIPSGVYSTSASAGWDKDISFNPLTGTFEGSLGGLGTFSQTLEFSEIENLGKGKIEAAGTLSITLAGCENPAVITPGWQISATGKAGIGAPVVLVVDVIFPPAAPAVHFLLTVPVVKEVVGALKVRLYIIGGLGLSGEYEEGQTGDCFLGTTSLNVSGTLGLEAQALVEFYGAEAGIYAGATGTPEVQICPDLIFEGITFRGYVGVFASAFLFEYSNEVGVEIRFDNGGKAMVLGMMELPGDLIAGDSVAGSWRPIGSGLSRYGPANRPAAAKPVKLMDAAEKAQGSPSEEETIVENVVAVANPAIFADESETLVLFSLFDPEKPWYAATDIGAAQPTGDDSWSIARIADDDAADFSPKIAPVDSETVLAAWERVSGDVSDANGPGDILPHLEIAAALLDTDTGLWTEPVQITDNNVVDREPLPVVFGASEGIVWIQNEADAAPGDANRGDSLMYAEYAGSAWSEPSVLWSGPNGILGVAFTPDSNGQGHIVFAVDQDGDPNSKEDSELHYLLTAAGVWQPAIRLTNNTLTDSLPTLVAPDGSPVCVWDANGTVTYSPLDAWNPKEVYTQYTSANQAASLDAVTMPGGGAIAYTVQTESGVDIFASFYDAALDLWSLPRRLTNDEHAEAALSLACDGVNLVVAYLKTQTERNDIDIEINGQIHHLENIPQPAQTDLCLLRYSLGNDIAVGSITIEPSNPFPGSSATITASIENRGDIPLENAQIEFFDGDPNRGNRIGDIEVITKTFIAGAEKNVSVSWNVPADVNAHDIYVVADPCMSVDDRDRSNNTVSVRTVLPDLTIESCRSTDVSGNSVALTAKVVNSGVLPSGAFDVSWRLGSETGEQIGISSLESMEPDASYEVTYTWNMAGRTFSDEYIEVFAVADAADNVFEFDETNNLNNVLIHTSSDLPEGDLNGDYCVNFGDFSKLADLHLGAVCSEPDWCAGADFDHNEILDMTDIAELTSYWLTCVAP